MANWASTDYVIEGPKETLLKIKEAIKHPVVAPNSSDGWEGNILNTLGIKWEEQPDSEQYYMRGFIQDLESVEFNPETDSTLSFYAEEAWGATDFHEALEKGIPDIKVYYCVVEEGCEVYATNDKEGKYFAYRWNVDACLNGNYEYEDFITEEDMYKWLSRKTNGKVKDAQGVEEFNSNYDDSEDSDDNYIWVHKYDIVE
jgi:hypothetical protein